MRRAPAHVDGHHAHVDAVGGAEPRGGDDLGRSAQRGETPALQQTDAMGAEKGVIRIVGREDDGQPARGQRADGGEHPDLVAEVEIGGGLVEHEDAGLLGDGARDERELALAATQLSVEPGGESADAQGGERGLRDLVVAGPGGGEEVEVSGAPHEHEV